MLDAAMIAIAVAVALAAVWSWTRGAVVLRLAGLWLAYGVYEYLMFKRVLCTGECNIRVDLLFIYPMLLLATLGGLGWWLWRAFRRGHGDSAGR